MNMIKLGSGVVSGSNLMVSKGSKTQEVAQNAPYHGISYMPRALVKHLPFRGPWPWASPRATKPGRGSTRTVNRWHMVVRATL